MESLVESWRFAAGLKMEKRRGWMKLGLDRVESVADHSYALAFLAMLEAEHRKYDLGTVLSLALIHDMEEAITGDLTPADKRTRGSRRVLSEKRRAIREIVGYLPAKSRSRYRRLWADLGLSRTREARLVHELDKLEMALQARAYERKVGRAKVLDFYRSAAKEIRDPGLRRILGIVTCDF